MLGISIKQSDANLVIRWQLSKFEIPVSEIREITLDDTYAGAAKKAVRIGMPYGTTDRVVIQTDTRTYILFTTDPEAVKSKAEAIVFAEKS